MNSITSKITIEQRDNQFSGRKKMERAGPGFKTACSLSSCCCFLLRGLVFQCKVPSTLFLAMVVNDILMSWLLTVL